MSHQRTVYVIDDDLESRRSFTIQLAAIGAEAWPFATAEEFVEIAGHLMPACILLDMDIEAPTGLEVLGLLKDRGIAWPIIAMSGASQVSVAVEAMKLGALDFLEKPVHAPKLAAALIPAWSALESSLAQGEARRQAQELMGRLTPREFDIALALFAGHSNKVVAHDLGISVRTVEMHRAHIMAKLGVRSIAEAAVMATHAGLATRGGTAPAVRPAAPAPLHSSPRAFATGRLLTRTAL
ncbi:MAG TPA: response regulator [Allosphingosinicella sp.]|jgi:two-component system response regulator FixJ